LTGLEFVEHVSKKYSKSPAEFVKLDSNIAIKEKKNIFK
jgi:hypothetical protein